MLVNKLKYDIHVCIQICALLCQIKLNIPYCVLISQLRDPSYCHRLIYMMALVIDNHEYATNHTIDTNNHQIVFAFRFIIRQGYRKFFPHIILHLFQDIFLGTHTIVGLIINKKQTSMIPNENLTIVVVSVQQLDLRLPMQSVPITIKIVNSNSTQVGCT